MSTRKLVIFDFDGTLADTRASGALALAEFSRLRGLPHDIDKLSAGWVDPLTHDLGWGIDFAAQPAMLREYHAFCTEQQLQKRFPAPLFDGVETMLRQLAPIYDLGIVTIRDRPSFLEIADSNAIMPYFHSFRSSCCMTEKGKSSKPAPDAVLCLIEESGHRLEDCIVIGDTTADIDMANAAGVKSIAVLWGSHSAERLAQSRPNVTVSNVGHLPAAIKKLFHR